MRIAARSEKVSFADFDWWCLPVCKALRAPGGACYARSTEIGQLLPAGFCQLPQSRHVFFTGGRSNGQP